MDSWLVPIRPRRCSSTWLNQFAFRLEGEGDNEPGLRLPQIGALHAIAAHFSVGTKFEPATVVLPTGTGKTETMLAAQVYLRPERTLVLVSGIPCGSSSSRSFALSDICRRQEQCQLSCPGRWSRKSLAAFGMSPKHRRWCNMRTC